MMRISDLHILDQNGRHLTCEQHSVRFQRELKRELSEKVCTFLEKAKNEESCGIKNLSNFNFKIEETDDDGEEFYSLCITPLDGNGRPQNSSKIEIALDDQVDELNEGAQEIIDTVKNIWKKHHHHSHYSAPHTSRHRPSRDERSGDFEESRVNTRNPPPQGLDGRAAQTQSASRTPARNDLQEELPRAQEPIRTSRENIATAATFPKDLTHLNPIANEFGAAPSPEIARSVFEDFEKLKRERDELETQLEEAKQDLQAKTRTIEKRDISIVELQQELLEQQKKAAKTAPNRFNPDAPDSDYHRFNSDVSNNDRHRFNSDVSNNDRCRFNSDVSNNDRCRFNPTVSDSDYYKY